MTSIRKKTISIQEIIDFLGADLLNVHGDIKDVFIDNLADVENTNATTLDWINPANANKQQITESSKAKVIIVDPELVYSENIRAENKIFISVTNPKLCLINIAEAFFTEKRKTGIHPSSVIDPSATLGKNIYIGPNTIIGKSIIGNDTYIEGNCFIYDNVIIENNVEIHAGVIVGSEAHNFIVHDSKRVRFPHMGGVVIKNDVTIGAHTVVCRGVLSDTIIGEGTKIAQLVIIGANNTIGNNCAIRGNVMISGSVVLGDNTVIAPSVTIRDQRIVGDRCFIGMGAVVIKNIPAGETWVGNPARKLKNK